MKVKICSKCGDDKPINEFNKRTRSKDGLRSDCKLCRKEISKKYRENNVERIKESNKNWFNVNIDKAKKINCVKSKKYRENNPEKIKETYNNWRKNNPEYEKIKHRNNPHIKAWRNILHNSLLRLGKTKEGHTIDLLGYSALELKNHIEKLFTNSMSWGNYGEWHIDHIKRICEFPKDIHPSVVNGLSNLRPLWATTRAINGVLYEGNLNRG